jgi:8-amino-7-oxononanoate synthase
VLDFTSALYLAMRHPSWSLRPWPQLTTGSPGALVAPPGAENVAAELARLVGCEAATLVPSTLHVNLDLFGKLAKEKIIIFMRVFFSDLTGEPLQYLIRSHL